MRISDWSSDVCSSDLYTDAQNQRVLAMEEAQLAEMKAAFDYDALSPAGQLSYRLFENEVARDREQFEWRWHEFPISTNGSPAGQIPEIGTVSWRERVWQYV